MSGCECVLTWLALSSLGAVLAVALIVRWERDDAAGHGSDRGGRAAGRE